MSLYTRIHRDIESAPLDDLINGEHGSALADAALDLAEAFSAMPADQIMTACHHDYRLSDRLRKATRELSAMIEERAEELAQEERKQAADDAAWDRGWDMAGDRIALERAANL